MFPLEKLNARKLSLTWKMDSSEEEESFYWVLSRWAIKEKRKKNKETLILGSWDISPACFSKAAYRFPELLLNWLLV